MVTFDDLPIDNVHSDDSTLVCEKMDVLVVGLDGRFQPAVALHNDEQNLVLPVLVMKHSQEGMRCRVCSHLLEYIVAPDSAHKLMALLHLELM